MKNGVTNNNVMILLKLISEKDRYGYEIIETLSKRSNNVFEMKVGTLYPILHNLVKSGFLTSYSEEVNGKLRKYYHITDEGRKYLDAILDEWFQYQSSIQKVIGGEIYGYE